MDDHQRERNVLDQLVKAQDAIKYKYKLLKHDRAETDKVLNETFKPIVDPLKTLVTDVKPLKNLVSEKKTRLQNLPIKKFVKKEPKHETSYIASNAAVDKYQFAQTTDEDTDDTITYDDPKYYNSLSEASEDESEKEAIDVYVDALNKNQTGFLDLIYGPRRENDGTYRLGKSTIAFEKKVVKINGFTFPKTDGLMELLVAKQPDTTIILPNDKKNYKEILEISCAHRKKNSASETIKTHNSNKFNNIIGPLFDLTKEPSADDSIKIGKSLPSYKVARKNSNMDYVYWDDPNELVDRLRLLVAEQSAGNNGHINEISSIIEELREGGYIY